MVLLAQLGCNLINPCGDSDALPYYDIKEYTMNALQLTSDTSSDPFIDPGDTVDATTLRLSLRARVNYHAYIQPSPGLISGAYACSPAEPGQSGTRERLDSIVVTSDASFDSMHPAGTSLNDVFAFFIHEITTTPLSSTIQPGQMQPPEYFSLAPLKAPVVDKQHTFTIRIYQTGNESYTLVSPAIRFH